jgi:hypothetical protein
MMTSYNVAEFSDDADGTRGDFSSTAAFTGYRKGVENEFNCCQTWFPILDLFSYFMIIVCLL